MIKNRREDTRDMDTSLPSQGNIKMGNKTIGLFLANPTPYTEQHI